MNGLSADMYHGQVVGKIGFIKRCMDNIDPDSVNSLLRSEYKEEIEWSTKPFEEIFEASKAGKCPDLDTLGKKALVLQELMLLIDSVKPFSLNQELLEAHYVAFKKENNLWNSKYHKTLTVLDGLIKASEFSAVPKKYFFKAIVSALKHHIATHGIVEDHAEIKKLIQLSETIKDTIDNSFEQQYTIFKAFVESLVDDSSLINSLETEVRQGIIQTLLEHSQKLFSATLREQLAAILQSGIINKALLVTFSETIGIDHQLQSFAQLTLRGHRLDALEIEAIYSDAVKKSVDNPLDYTRERINRRLLCRVYPKHEECIQKSSFNSTSPFLAIDVIQEIASKSTKEPGSEAAIWQLVTPLRLAHVKSPEMSMEQLVAFIDEKSKSVIDAIPRRNEQLKLLGSTVYTFNEVEDVIRPILNSGENKDSKIIREFHEAIHDAKMRYFYIHPYREVKQIEHITSNDVTQFYNECCVAGQKAATKLADNRSLLTVIVDVLRSLANLAIRILTLGASPQFFTPKPTSVDIISSALEKARTHIMLNLEQLNNDSETSRPDNKLQN
ncbi:hypothetical protein [Legionella bononiensis]|uniref:Uncharacterized protein n=1 Tax=Legionella bononiensis TaxID=2793102 RepID=A0ABS1WEC5_9GAMM|nr:hypothetical protein [Legionella bononiensis]MBL7479411.1 hypothetical protein [Legionella bononiensis]MBL7527716.1 hypothetical protein [Legionella bononiensis]MBL7563601.1 hypothetical protein [Legionella bononiensis]